MYSIGQPSSSAGPAPTSTGRGSSGRSGTWRPGRATPRHARDGHDPDRPRKLLLHRGEIERLIGRTSEKGLTLIPTRIYWKGPRAKVEIALARGKNVQDKRRYLKEKDARREIERA